jgi:predicted dehydrogenase
MIKVGILGFGFMGKMHFNCLKAMKNVKISAICDIDASKFEKCTDGNLKNSYKQNVKNIRLYTNFDQMLAETDLDAVSITLPTYLHCTYTVKALRYGLHVLCEKPMALNLSDCKKMIDTAEKTQRILQIGHCIRFWPAYAMLKEIVDSAKYGSVLAATFRRLSSAPNWSWNDWFMDKYSSGGATIDLHIHDSDFVQYLFGMPKAVFSKGIKGPSNDYDHIVTNYFYEDSKIVTAEGGWIMKPSFTFEMSFNVMFEKATISYDCTRDPMFRIYTKNDVIVPVLVEGDGYSCELMHWVNTIRGMKVAKVITPIDSLNAVKLVLAEKASCGLGRKVSVK